MDYQAVLEELEERAGGLDREASERALRATLASLGERLLPLDLSFLAAELPAPFGELLRARENPGEFTLEELFQRVARREAVAEGFGREHALAVCQVLSRRLSPEVRFHLQERLPDDFAALLEPSEPPRQAVHLHRPEEPRATLSSGRPGGRRPLSEAAADRTQSGSVASEQNPHAETKLSSTEGLTQERERRTLAEGHPGIEHPLSDSD
ncbi:MAG: DUF2267 domain-containing protein [Deltaproteobacteria bacterium]|nr:DUF2267 domain-containing protein [Deltaproteobacteria bacterium]